MTPTCCSTAPTRPRRVARPSRPSADPSSSSSPDEPETKHPRGHLSSKEQMMSSAPSPTDDTEADVVTWRTESPGVTVVTMARPPANALGPALLDGLHAAIDAAENAGDVKVMVISSAVEGFFAAGADIKHIATIDAE